MTTPCQQLQYSHYYSTNMALITVQWLYIWGSHFGYGTEPLVSVTMIISNLLYFTLFVNHLSLVPPYHLVKINLGQQCGRPAEAATLKKKKKKTKRRWVSITLKRQTRSRKSNKINSKNITDNSRMSLRRQAKDRPPIKREKVRIK